MFTHDGCFKLNNQRTRNPKADVRLSDGECMLVGSTRYQAHLKVTKEPANVSALTVGLLLIQLMFHCRESPVRTIARLQTADREIET